MVYETDFSILPLCLQDKITIEEFTTITEHIDKIIIPINKQLDQLLKRTIRWFIGFAILTLPTAGICWVFVPALKHEEKFSAINNKMGKELVEYCLELNKTWEARGIQWVYKSANTLFQNVDGRFIKLPNPLIEVTYRVSASTTPTNTEGSQP